METLGAKTKVNALASLKKRRAKKLKRETAGIETSNPFEVLGDVGVEVESPALSLGTPEIFQPATLSPSQEFLDDDSVMAPKNVCQFSGLSDRPGVNDAHLHVNEHQAGVPQCEGFWVSC